MRDASPTRPTRRTHPSGPIAWLLSAAIAVVACAPLWHHHGPEHVHDHEGAPESHPTCVVCHAVRTTGLDLPAPPPLLFAVESGPAVILGGRRAAHLTQPRPISPRGPPPAAAA